LAFDQTGWRPTYYAAEDQFILENNYKVISNLKGFLKFSLEDTGMRFVVLKMEFTSEEEYQKHLILMNPVLD